MTGPLVSCVMPTRDRRRFAGRAIAYFMRQDYPDRELVIADDGDDPVADLIPASPLIRYVRLARPLVLGDKRNLVNGLARGEILLHWDDDDWSAPDRIGRQVAVLRATGADLCGSGDQLYYRPDADRAWRYRYPRRDRWVSGSTLCYRRTRWERHPFRPVPSGEDNRFVWAGSPPVEVPGPFHIGIIHAGNTSPKNTSGRQWSPVPAGTVHRHLGPDLAYYRTLR